ncbi:hypothetical protein A3Q56_02225 [Intoshia linei]|uniref:t-SNARE coiled-coil homology domain-containing protein n=1 Tax=Intoshia linei TaxID=1819745 RepID=A0A177B6U4_9BILA|nr:hypothetical protein A3Q56_02225 [Intoshia linei]
MENKFNTKNNEMFYIIFDKANSIAIEITKLMKIYYENQQKYRINCKKWIQRQMELSNKIITDQEIEDLIESGNPTILTQDIVTQTKEAKQSLKKIQSRYNDIIKLEQSVKKLYELFMDMADLVESKGESINRIEYNILKSIDYAETTTKHTKRAFKYRNKSRKVKNLLLS